MMQKMRKFFSRESGQGMTEYIIIVALIAIAAIGVVTVFGDNIRALFGASVNALASESDVTVNTDKGDKQAKRKNLKSFASDNGHN